jgi:hypothetical protein
VYSSCYNVELYEIVKTGSKLAGGYKIISFCKMYVGVKLKY